MFRRNRSKISDSNKRQQKKTFILCFGIVCVFVCSTAPMMVAFVVPWNAPQQLIDTGTHLLAFNAVGTSTIYLVQYYTNRRVNSRRVIERARDVKNNSSKRDCSEAISGWAALFAKEMLITRKKTESSKELWDPDKSCHNELGQPFHSHINLSQNRILKLYKDITVHSNKLQGLYHKLFLQGSQRVPDRKTPTFSQALSTVSFCFRLSLKVCLSLESN